MAIPDVVGIIVNGLEELLKLFDMAFERGYLWIFLAVLVVLGILFFLF